MNTLFLLCALFGGALLLVQSLIGGDDETADGDLDAAADTGDVDHHGSSWIFGVLSFRTLVIGLTFFGLFGKAALASNFDDPWPLFVAVAGALGAMYGVYFLMQAMHQLNADGTVRLARAVGLEGVVYVPIPAEQKGAGKVHLTLQNRLVECEAITSGGRLPTGSRILVVGVLGPDRVEVEPAPETAGTTHA